MKVLSLHRLSEELRHALPERGAGWEVASLGECKLLLTLLERWVASAGGRIEGEIARQLEPDPDEDRLAGAPLGIYRVVVPGRGDVWFNVERSLFFGDTTMAAVAARTGQEIDWLFRELLAFHVAEDRRSGIVPVRGHRRIPLPSVTWDDIVLPAELLADIRSTVMDFAGGRERYARLGIPWRRGLLLTGPPGNGKTKICKAVAATSGMPFVYLAADAERGEDTLERAFARARWAAPAVLCVEDLDSLFAGEASLSYFLNKLDGFEDNTGLLVLATTNHPEALDPALLRRPSRFDWVWKIPDPDLGMRLAFLRRLLADAVEAGMCEQIAEATDGFSMAFLQELRTSAGLRALREGRDHVLEEDLRECLRLLREQWRTSRTFDSDRPIGFERKRPRFG